LVMGGFHLSNWNVVSIKKIKDKFIEWNVKKIGPCHCSGGLAKNIFRRYWGKDYIEIGVGKIISIEGLN